MSERLTIELHNRQQAWAAIKSQAFPFLAAVLQADRRWLLTIKPETRRESQSRHFHSLIGQIAGHVGGELADPEDAKRILISAFRIDTIQDPELAGEWARFGDVRMGRGLRGEVVLLGIQSRDFTVRLGGAFVAWLYAFGAEVGVRFKAWEGEEM